MLDDIFPWIDDEERALAQRISKLGKRAHDQALISLLGALRFFRQVLLQDGAVLFAKYPNLELFKYHPFTTAEFCDFSAESVTIIQNAEERAHQNLAQLPEAMAMSFRGILETTSIRQETVNQSIQDTQVEISSGVSMLKTLVEAALLSGSSAKKCKAIGAALEQVSLSTTESAGMFFLVLHVRLGSTVLTI